MQIQKPRDRNRKKAYLKLQDMLVDGAARRETRHARLLVLAAAVGAAKGLLLDGVVPPGVHHNDAGGHGEVEADAAGGQRGEEDGDGLGGEFVDGRGTRGGREAAVVEHKGPGFEFADAGEDAHLGLLGVDV